MDHHPILDPYMLHNTFELDVQNEDVSRVLGRFTSQLGQHSYMLNKPLTTAQDVAAHGFLFEQQEAEALRVAQSRFDNAEKPVKKVKEQTPAVVDKDYEEYVKLCQQRKLNINNTREAWKKAIIDANAAKAAWDNYVREMRLAFDNAKNEPVPTRVVR